MRKVLEAIGKSVATMIIAALIVFAAFSISPIYDFEYPSAFSGPDIFDPYAQLDTTVGWKRANFHTHTRVKGILNECRYWPDEVLEDYQALGYDILTFSNHNELTSHPVDTSLQVNVYEHGYGLYKFHKLVFGADEVNHFDHLLPLLASQKQWQLDILGRNSDFIQLNHPFRTGGTSPYQMSVLTGYRIMELDSGVTTEQEYWDWALSSGHYSYGLANDDCHDSKTSYKIAVRCNWLNTPSARYDDIKKTLLGGAYYSMRVPDYGSGDWGEKYRANASLPYISDIGLRDSVIFMTLSIPAERIVVWGQDHTQLETVEQSDTLEYVMRQRDAYARVTAYFEDGAVIYTNPFARYDAEKAPTPYRESGHPVNVALTVLWNLALSALIALLLFALRSVLGSARR